MNTLRQQMTEAMVLRGFAARTQEAYLASVTALARHYQRPPDALNGEQLQAYLLFLITEKKLAYASVNQAASAFRFLFERVLRREHVRLDVPMAKVPRRLPQILSRDAVAHLIRARAARIGTRCCRRGCLSNCACIGGWCIRACGCFPILGAARPSMSRWRSARMARPATRQAFPRRAASTPCGIALPLTCSKRGSIYPVCSDCSAMVRSAPPCAICTWPSATSPAPPRRWNCLI